MFLPMVDFVKVKCCGKEKNKVEPHFCHGGDDHKILMPKTLKELMPEMDHNINNHFNISSILYISFGNKFVEQNSKDLINIKKMVGLDSASKRNSFTDLFRSSS